MNPKRFEECRFRLFFWKKLQLILILYLSLDNGVLHAQEVNELGSPLITNFRNGIELLKEQNWSGIKDSRGILYIGSDAGIIEFDGIEKKIIPRTSTIRHFCFGKDSVIYGAGDFEFGYLAYDSTGQTVFVSLYNRLKTDNISLGRFSRVFATEHGVFFLSPTEIVRYRDNQFKIYKINLNSRLANSAYNKMFIYPKNKDIGVWEDGKVHYLPHTKKVFVDGGKIELMPFAGNKLLIVTKNKGFYIYHYDRWLRHKLYPNVPAENIDQSILEEFPTEIDEYVKQNIIYPSVYIDSNNYAFGTLTGGVVIMDAKGKLVRVINEERGLFDNIIYNLFVDENKNLWAIMKNGVSCIEVGHPLSYFSKINGLTKNINDVAKANGRLYIAHEKGVSCLSDYSLKLTNDKQVFENIPHIKGGVLSLCAFKNILLCEGDEKLYAVYNNKSKLIGRLPSTYSIIKSSRFENHFFFCNDRTGLGYFKLKYEETGEHSKFPKVQVVILKQYKELPPCYLIVEDPEGNLLLNTVAEQLVSIKFLNNSIDSIGIKYLDPSNRINNTPHFLTRFDNQLFLIKENKMMQAKFIGHGWDSLHSFIPEKYFGGMFSDSLVSIQNGGMNGENEMWIQHNQKTKLLKASNGKLAITTLPVGNIEIENLYIDGNGIIWINSTSELYRLDPSVRKNYYKKFNALIRQISIGADSIVYKGAFYNPAYREKKHFLKTSLCQAGTPIPCFSFSDNYIKFEYAATFYESMHQNKYSCMLEGFKDNWSPWSTKSKKEYSYLPEGQYTFKVKAKNVYGVESNICSYSFMIYPPWYRTVWAYIGYVILLVILFILGVKIYSYRLIATKKRLESIIAKRTREVSQKNMELSKQLEEIRGLEMFKESMINMIVHDLKNPLNNIIGFSSEKNMNTSMVLSSGKNMLNMVENILNVHKFEKSKIKLNVEENDIKNIVNQAVQEVTFLATKKSIDLIHDVDSCYFLFDADLIKRVIINLLNNAVKFSPENQSIIISSQPIAYDNKEFVEISISDKGNGIPPEMREKVFDKYVQVEARKSGLAHSTGLGLTFCKIAIEAHKGKIGVVSDVGNGSTFFFTLPFIK